MHYSNQWLFILMIPLLACIDNPRVTGDEFEVTDAVVTNDMRGLPDVDPFTAEAAVPSTDAGALDAFAPDASGKVEFCAPQDRTIEILSVLPVPSFRVTHDIDVLRNKVFLTHDGRGHRRLG